MVGYNGGRALDPEALGASSSAGVRPDGAMGLLERRLWLLAMISPADNQPFRPVQFLCRYRSPGPWSRLFMIDAACQLAAV